MPVQRLPRYVLLLQELLDCTPPTDRDYVSLKKGSFTFCIFIAIFIELCSARGRACGGAKRRRRHATTAVDGSRSRTDW